MKANKTGWIRHRGGKCPVEAGTLVDVRFRSGITKTVCDSQSFRWSHSAALGDIMAYRLHTPSEQPLAVDPLAWRDRITEIDAESKAEEERHGLVMTALDSEREELVRKLSSEGLALIAVGGKK